MRKSAPAAATSFWVNCTILSVALAALADPRNRNVAAVDFNSQSGPSWRFLRVPAATFLTNSPEVRRHSGLVCRLGPTLGRPSPTDITERKRGRDAAHSHPRTRPEYLKHSQDRDTGRTYGRYVREVAEPHVAIQTRGASECRDYHVAPTSRGVLHRKEGSRSAHGGHRADGAITPSSKSDKKVSS